MDRRPSLLTLSLLLWGMAAASVEGGTTSATLTVSARVLAGAVVEVDSAPREIDVTAADVARGFVEVERPIQLRVRTNSRSGYQLVVQKLAGHFRSVELTNGAARVNVQEESWLARPFSGLVESMTFRARLHLPVGTAPGTYPLALAFSAHPL